MAKLACPRCQTPVPTHRGWASAAVSTLIAAPAVPDMATQVRCPNCQYLFAEAELRHERPPYLSAWQAGALVLVLALVAWWLA